MQEHQPFRDTNIRSINSLSTISGGPPLSPEIAANVRAVDERVRRSLASKSVSVVGSRGPGMARSFTSATTRKVNVIPVGVVTRTSQPLHKYQSMKASPGSIRGENTISYVSEASGPPLPQSAVPVQLQDPPPAVVESPRPTRLSEQLGLDIIGASKASLVGSSPESLKSLSPKPLSPIPDYPASATFVAQHPQAFVVLEDEEPAIGIPESPPESIRSRTYRHALENPVPIPDPMPMHPRRIPRLSNTIPRPRPQPQPYILPAKIEDSQGKALIDAEKAMFGTDRPASERFYWTLPAEHDTRVLALLTWIHRFKHPLASLAVSALLTSRSSLLTRSIPGAQIPRNPAERCYLHQC